MKHHKGNPPRSRDNETLDARRFPAVEVMREVWRFTPTQLIAEINLGYRKKNTARWHSWFRESPSPTPRFRQYISTYNNEYFLRRTLLKIIRLGDPSHPLLGKQANILTGAALASSLQRHGISQADLDSLWQHHHDNLPINGPSFRPAPASTWKELCSQLGNDYYQSLDHRRPTVQKQLLRSFGFDVDAMDVRFRVPVEKRGDPLTRRRPLPGHNPPAPARRLSKQATDALSRTVQETLIIGEKTRYQVVVAQDYRGVRPADRPRRTVCGRTINLRHQVQASLDKLAQLGFKQREMSIE